MPSLHYRKGDRSPHQVVWREEGRQRSKRFRDRKVAIQFLADTERRLDLGAHAPQVSDMTIGDWLETWIAVDGPTWASTTERQRTYILQRWALPFVGHVKLRDFGIARAKLYRVELLRANATHATINSVMRVMSAALAAAVEQGEIPANPLRAHALRSLPQGPRDRRAVPVEAVEVIRRTFEHPRDRLIVSLMAYCGLRPAEVCGLRWGDAAIGQEVAAEPGHIVVARSVQRGRVVTTKTGRVRVVPMIAPVVEDLLAHRAQRVDGVDRTVTDDAPLVAGVKAGRFLDWHNWATRVWRPAARRLELPYVPYELRHTFASLNIAAGRTVLEVAAWMGHSSPTLTMSTYGHLFAQAQLRPGESPEQVVTATRRRLESGPAVHDAPT